MARDRARRGRPVGRRAASRPDGADPEAGGSGAGGPEVPAARGAVVIPVRVRPGAATTRVGGGHQGRYGRALVVAVNAPAVDGRATEVALRVVAEALGLRPAGVTLRTGRTSRDKLFEVADPPADLPDRLRALLDR